MPEDHETSKVLLTYKDDQDMNQLESVWATKIGDYYRIDNIPFLASNIALGDVVSVEMKNNELHFAELIHASGDSTIQIIVFNEDDLMKLEKDLEEMGCTWEGSHIKNLISVDVPKEVDYSIVNSFLYNGERKGIWSYKEACLAHDNN